MEYSFTDLDKNWQWMQAGKFLRSLQAAEEFGGLMKGKAPVVFEKV